MPDDTPSQANRGDERGLPTAKELQRLPRWANVAYAVRCAQRVQALVGPYWPDVPQENIEVIDRAIQLAQSAAIDPVSASKEILYGAISAATTVCSMANSAGSSTEVSVAAASAVVNAANVAVNAVDAASYNAAFTSVYAANAAVHAASAASTAVFTAVSGADVATAAALEDYDFLRRLASREGWTDESPVNPNLLGPLWPHGEPEGWPIRENTALETNLKIEIATPAHLDGASREALNGRIAAFFAELSAMHVAMGGNGLKILDEDSCEPIPLEDEVPVSEEAGCEGVTA